MHAPIELLACFILVSYRHHVMSDFYRHHVMSDFTYNVSYSAVFIFIFKNIQCYRGAENQYYFYRLTYYPVR